MKNIRYLMLRNIENQHQPKMSKVEDRQKNDGKCEYIHAIKTVETYIQQCRSYADWLKERGEYHCTPERARELAGEYIHTKYPNSAWSQHTARAALARGLDCPCTDLCSVDKRVSMDITRSRGYENDTARTAAIEANYPDAVAACRSMGCRDEGLRQLVRDAVHENGDGRLRVTLREKGGRVRDVITLPGRGEDYIRERCLECSHGEKLFSEKELPLHADVHSYRERFAADLYDQCAAAGEHVSGRYYCPRDGSELKLDTGICDYVNEQIGHGSDRFETLYYNYLAPGWAK